MKLTTKLMLALSLALALFGIAYAQATKPPQPAPQVSMSNGRYQLVMSTLAGKNTFLVDTQNGRV
jgi:trimethylamine:corrinoid methyltransferase-like protein